MSYLYLAIAICFEVLASSALKASNEFKLLLPSLLVIIGYIGAFYFMTLSLRQLTLATVYASWSGLGIVLVTLVGVFYYKEKIDLASIVGMGLIIAGVLVMNLLSETNTHS
jgi:small multidrug resistance pump